MIHLHIKEILPSREIHVSYFQPSQVDITNQAWLILERRLEQSRRFSFSQMRVTMCENRNTCMQVESHKKQRRESGWKVNYYPHFKCGKESEVIPNECTQ